jgi:plastocyanin domain-containing protein
MKHTATFITLFLIGLLGFLLFSTKKSESPTIGLTNNGANVVETNGTQIITINVKGGYFPRTSFAKANLPTTILFKTEGTFDCSSAVRIPSLRLQAFLPSTGVKEMVIPPQQPGTSLQGTCSMGMYNFTINFN